MSTRSVKAIFDPETREAIMSYTHFDGYPGYMGKMLTEHYSDLEKARRLISLGDASSVRPFITPQEAGYSEEKAKTHSFDKPLKTVSVFYKRDRGEDGVDAITKKHTDPMHIFAFVKRHYSWTEYLWLGIPTKNGKVVWYYTDLYDKNPHWYRMSKKDGSGPLKKEVKEMPPKLPVRH